MRTLVEKLISKGVTRDLHNPNEECQDSFSFLTHEPSVINETKKTVSKKVTAAVLGGAKALKSRKVKSTKKQPLKTFKKHQ